MKSSWDSNLRLSNKVTGNHKRCPEVKNLWSDYLRFSFLSQSELRMRPYGTESFGVGSQQKVRPSTNEFLSCNRPNVDVAINRNPVIGRLKVRLADRS